MGNDMVRSEPLVETEFDLGTFWTDESPSPVHARIS